MAGDIIRSTQRAPKSCTACYAKKIKCSKELPCRQCVRRGVPTECRREVVRVKGRIQTVGASQSSPSYADILQENLRLGALLAGHTLAPGTESTVRLPSLADKTEWYENQLFDDFWSLQSGAEPLEHAKPLWLAVYFSILASTLLFMSDEVIATIPALPGKPHDLLRNWYNAALYFLDRGDFTQRPHINTVQAIVILGMLFTNMGDISRQKILWSVAIRVAQQLKLGNDSAHEHESFFDQQVRRRLWWTIVICEWLPIPFHTPFINDVDFDCQLPEDVDDEELSSPSSHRLSRSKPRPVQYHIIMARLARIYYSFRYKLRVRTWSADEITNIVLAADDELANLVGELPPFLQSDQQSTNTIDDCASRQPWMLWQSQSLAMVFLYYRIAINRVLQQHWLQGSPNQARVRAICLSSAQAIVRAIVNGKLDTSKFRSW
ncbi:fungal-specific transcription factor domain-containing protein [Pestalotiopsis sp. NC0098]|nr:fungal-specific transcription factor domain-containing protein [Pestalotiopsis sp. NC0098]